MNYTNLNITDSNHQFKYFIERRNGEYSVIKPSYFNIPDGDKGFIYNGESNLLYKDNYWVDFQTVTDPAYETHDTYVPSPYKTSKMTLYFPRFSVETYEKNVKYALTIYTWILGKKIILRSLIVDRQDSLAIETGPKTFLNDKYYEYVDIDIIDPYEFLYGDNWTEWRQHIGEVRQENLNDGGSNIGVNLCVVENVNGSWIKKSGYEESQSALLITDNINDYLSCHIKSNTDTSTNTPSVECSIKFNSNYDQTSQGLAQYLRETYGINDQDVSSKFILIIQDKNDVYKYVEHKHTGIISSDYFSKAEIGYESWDEYQEGLKISVLFQIVHDEEADEIEWMTFMSNYIFLDQELFKYLVGDNDINNIQLNQVDMNNYNIDVVNKIVNNVVSVERPDDYKANIIKPVFFKTQKGSNITIHPAVTENISINLDDYKNKVHVFTIKIGDHIFQEIGRTPGGVIFKIVGANIEADNGDTGTYYILDDNGELVTTGEYKAVI